MRKEKLLWDRSETELLASVLKIWGREGFMCVFCTRSLWWGVDKGDSGCSFMLYVIRVQGGRCFPQRYQGMEDLNGKAEEIVDIWMKKYLHLKKIYICIHCDAPLSLYEYIINKTHIYSRISTISPPFRQTETAH